MPSSEGNEAKNVYESAIPNHSNQVALERKKGGLLGESGPKINLRHDTTRSWYKHQ